MNRPHMRRADAIARLGRRTTAGAFVSLVAALSASAAWSPAAQGADRGSVAPDPASKVRDDRPAACAGAEQACVSRMSSPRDLHVAASLPDGRILLAGGLGRVGWAVASADLYDPERGVVVPTGRMSTARAIATASVLDDGRVLVAGGARRRLKGDTASAELYDPETGRFELTGSMTVARSGQTASVLPDGRVLFAGGSESGPGNGPAELYDPVTGRFLATGAMTTDRVGHTATLLPDGGVLLAGGRGRKARATAEVYDPTSGTFLATGAMTTARHLHAAALLPDGRVLIVGGQGTSNEPLASAEIYDPATGRFDLTADMATGRVEPVLASLPDGRVLVTGGWDVLEHLGTFEIDALRSVEVYDPVTQSFAALDDMARPRANHTATLMADGRVVLAGGPSAWIEIYSPRPISSWRLETGRSSSSR